MEGWDEHYADVSREESQQFGSKKQPMPQRLADRYRELMAFRREGLQKYKTSEFSTLSGPPGKVYLPRIRRARDKARFRIGELALSHLPPLWYFAEHVVDSASHPLGILEIGPGEGALAAHLQSIFADRISRYLVLERDESFVGPYERVADLGSIQPPVDLAIAGEVAEHMTADQWYEHILQPLCACASRDLILIMSVPNPIAPGGIGRDITHVQAYPWYDLYALLRLEFQKVDVYRVYWASTLQRIAFLPWRMTICPAMELDWCDTIICVASEPIL